MSLVDDDITHLHLRKITPEQESREPLGRDVQELEVAVAGIIENKVHLIAAHSGMHGQCLDSKLLKMPDLVLHQGNQRSDDNCDTLPHHRGHLEAD